MKREPTVKVTDDQIGGCGVMLVRTPCPCEDFKPLEDDAELCGCGHHRVMHATVE